MSFKLVKEDKKSDARLGKLKTRHGTIQTPCFMTIATCGSVKSLDSIEIKKMKAQIVLGNTYHLYLRPTDKLIKKFGGLHKFMNWDGPILTDSGGYQVFSLAKMRKITEEGAKFQSHINGSYHMLTPEKSIEIQQNLGSDIMMVLDECAPYPSTQEYIKKSSDMTSRWAKRCKDFSEKSQKSSTRDDEANKNLQKQLLFAIVQGGTYQSLRKDSAMQLLEIGFDGYAIGGVSVGEPSEKMLSVVDWTAPLLPKDKPRYLMGVGKPEEIVACVARGIDMFDCVIPTRNARHGTLYKFTTKSETIKVTKKPGKFYELMHITNEKFKSDKKPIDTNCQCFTCQNYSRAYLRHLFISKELLALRLASIHNIHFYLELMRKIRKSI